MREAEDEYEPAKMHGDAREDERLGAARVCQLFPARAGTPRDGGRRTSRG